MTQDEQKQLDGLREQLGEATRKIEQIRSYFSSALGRSTGEARLYRGLFWSLLFLMMTVTILHFFDK